MLHSSSLQDKIKTENKITVLEVSLLHSNKFEDKDENKTWVRKQHRIEHMHLWAIHVNFV